MSNEIKRLLPFSKVTISTITKFWIFKKFKKSQESTSLLAKALPRAIFSYRDNVPNVYKYSQDFE